MCTCGDTTQHIIMYRTSLDGLEVLLWDDGAVTGALGSGIKGVPIRRPRTEAKIDAARKAGRLFMGEVCIYDRDELGALYAAADRAARLDGLPGTMRRILRERRHREQIPTMIWTVTEADRNGRPVERFCRLPRLRWPGLVVFDACGRAGSSRGRYSLWRDDRRDGCCEPTGFQFGTLKALWAHLRTL